MYHTAAVPFPILSNLTAELGSGTNQPSLTDMLDTVTTRRKNLDQQVLQEDAEPETVVCETGISELKPSQVTRKANNRKGRKGSRTNQSVHLWEFVRDLLLSPQKNQEAVRWENRKEGTFRVVRSDMFAQLWGEQKDNKCMNYEKLSRALSNCHCPRHSQSTKAVVKCWQAFYDKRIVLRASSHHMQYSPASKTHGK
ncbi:hypothetical protein AB205_0087460, partial [Aquarana catesbeiana]